MKFLVDMTAPKQVLFFNPIIKELNNMGHEVFITTRRYEELNSLQKILGIKTRVIGQWQDTLEGKLLASLDRAEKLTRFIDKKKIDAGISLSSVELPRVMFGLGKPVFIFNDIPTLDSIPLIQSKLSLPLASLVFTPFCVPEEEFRKCGYNGEVVHFPCLDPVLWLKDAKVDKKILEKEGLNTDRKIIFLREAELKSSYLDKHTDIVFKVASKLKKKYPDVLFIAKPRYYSPISSFDNIIQLDTTDIQSVIACSDLLIGGGGTMNLEASYYGVPALYCRPKMATYERWIIKKGLGIKIRAVEGGVREASRILDDGITWKERAKKVFRKQYFPMEKIIKTMERAV